MPKPWLRLWDKTLDCPKAQGLSGETYKVWSNLLCLANRQTDRGTLPDLKKIAFCLRITESKASRYIDELVSVGLIDKSKDGLKMHDWEEWQPEYDSSRKRTRDYRERLRHRDGTNGFCDVTVTSQNCHGDDSLAGAQPGGRSETDTEKKPPKSPKGDEVVFILPDWIPETDWRGFIAMRKKIKKPLTDEGKLAAIEKLRKLKDAGDDPSEVLQASILGSWQGLFATNRRSNGPPRKPEPPLPPMHKKGQPL